MSHDECSDAVFLMPLNKSPGSNGVPTKFYRVFWEDVVQMVVNSFTYSVQRGFISDEQGRVRVTLIPIGNKGHRYLKNRLPIAMLNTGYKVAAKRLAIRMKTSS